MNGLLFLALLGFFILVHDLLLRWWAKIKDVNHLLLEVSPFFSTPVFGKVKALS
jgi:hypothetical protein